MCVPNPSLPERSRELRLASRLYGPVLGVGFMSRCVSAFPRGFCV